jgi:hypothetical protein
LLTNNINVQAFQTIEIIAFAEAFHGSLGEIENYRTFGIREWASIQQKRKTIARVCNQARPGNSPVGFDESNREASTIEFISIFSSRPFACLRGLFS